jgi:phosphonoacetaldehyde hydrolase
MTCALIAAACGGFAPGAVVCADEVAAGRPSPWMALEAARRLNTWPMRVCVKTGETLADIAEGRNVGMWSIGVAKTGNELGLSESEAAALPAPELARRLADADWRFRRAGVHDVIDSVAALPALLDSIEAALTRGQTP